MNLGGFGDMLSRKIFENLDRLSVMATLVPFQ